LPDAQGNTCRISRQPQSWASHRDRRACSVIPSVRLVGQGRGSTDLSQTGDSQLVVWACGGRSLARLIGFPPSSGLESNKTAFPPFVNVEKGVGLPLDMCGQGWELHTRTPDCNVRRGVAARWRRGSEDDEQRTSLQNSPGSRSVSVLEQETRSFEGFAAEGTRTQETLINRLGGVGPGATPIRNWVLSMFDSQIPVELASLCERRTRLNARPSSPSAQQTTVFGSSSLAVSGLIPRARRADTDPLSCHSKVPSESELTVEWPGMHTIVCLRDAGRRARHIAGQSDPRGSCFCKCIGHQLGNGSCLSRVETRLLRPDSFASMNIAPAPQDVLFGQGYYVPI
jgi:hypothetical protein